MRVLALDVGDKRTGMALSDALRYTAQPLDVWERRSIEEDLAQILALVRQYDVDTIVVGHPVTMAGTSSRQTTKTEQFAATLRERCPVPVVLWDERLTTAQGERALIEGGVRRRQRRIVVNQVAAQLLLQQYLDTQRGTTAT